MRRRRRRRGHCGIVGRCGPLVSGMILFESRHTAIFDVPASRESSGTDSPSNAGNASVTGRRCHGQPHDSKRPASPILHTVVSMGVARARKRATKVCTCGELPYKTNVNDNPSGSRLNSARRLDGLSSSIEVRSARPRARNTCATVTGALVLPDVLPVGPPPLPLPPGLALGSLGPPGPASVDCGRACRPLLPCMLSTTSGRECLVRLAVGKDVNRTPNRVGLVQMCLREYGDGTRRRRSERATEEAWNGSVLGARGCRSLLVEKGKSIDRRKTGSAQEVGGICAKSGAANRLIIVQPVCVWEVVNLAKGGSSRLKLSSRALQTSCGRERKKHAVWACAFSFWTRRPMTSRAEGAWARRRAGGGRQAAQTGVGENFGASVCPHQQRSNGGPPPEGS